MKIIVIRDTPLFEVNSANANRTLGLIKGLRRLGMDTEIVFLGIPEALLDATSISTYGEVRFVQPPFGFSGKLSFFNNYLFSACFSKYFAERLCRNRNEIGTIFWIQDSLLSFKVGTLLKKAFPQSKLFLEMSEFPDFYKEHNLSFRVKFLKDWKLKVYKNSLRPALDGIALMTKTLIEDFENSKKIPVLHLPMTVDIDRFAQNRSVSNATEDPYVAYIGLLGNHKDGIDVMLKSFRLISSDYEKLKLKIAGPKHHDSPKHITLCNSLNLNTRVDFVGEINKDMVPDFLNGATILLLPRPASRQAQGGFPTKLGEYLATSQPICATTVGEIPHYLEDGKTVFFAEPGSVESFANAMRRALNDLKNAKKVGYNGRKLAEREFNASVQAQNLANYFEQLLQNDRND